MRNYEVFFELFGKKMKVVIMAESEDDAKSKLKDEIKFHKVIKKKSDEFNDIIDMMDTFMDIFVKTPPKPKY